MKAIINILAFVTMLLPMVVSASWYWPFGSDDEKEPPRLSELMEQATELIDEASDLANEGKINEAVEKYREALSELDKVEAENPDRVKAPEFATLRTKRAYVSAAIDALLLTQVRDNAKPVAVSDTRELEKKLAAEKSGKKVVKDDKKAKGKAVKGKDKKSKDKVKKAKKSEKKPVKKPEVKPAKPLTRNERVMLAIEEKRFDDAQKEIKAMLNEKPNDATALNMKAAMEVEKGDLKEAERTLDQAIMSNPKDYCAYYNMVDVMLKADPESKGVAKRYYETGRALGGEQDADLEERLK